MNAINHITAVALQQKLAGNPDLLLLDVREDFEREIFNIGGIHIPLADVLSRVGEITKDKPVIVYCRKGVRSQIAIQKLQERFGFNNLLNLQGGLENWKDL